MTPLRFGILGTADIAARRFVPAVRAAGGVVTRVGGRDPAASRAWCDRLGVPAACGDLRSVVDADDVDVVYIALPNALHARWAQEALDAGRHVLVEKPLALDATQAHALVARARESGLTLMECMTFPRHRQHTAAFAAAGPLVSEGIALEAVFTIPRRDDSDIRMSADLGGGAIADLACYPVSVAVAALGPRLTVSDVEIVLDRERGVDVRGAATLSTPGSAARARIWFGFDLPYACEYTLVGQRGTVRVTRAFTAPVDHVPDVVVLDADARPVRRVPVGPDDQFARVVEDLRTAIGSGPPDAGPTTAVIEICDVLRAHIPAPVARGGIR